MSAEIQNIINEFVMMWVLIDPIGTIPVFMMATAGMTLAHRRMVAIRATVIATIVLLFFVFGGHFLLKALGIPITSFQIAGGVVLFLFALTMIFGPPKTEQEKEEAESIERARNVAVFPLAIPSIASPGAMLGAVLLVDADNVTWIDYSMNVGVTLIILAITLVFMLAAGPILRVIGESGVNVIGRIMGLILAAVAVDSVLEAISTYFKIAGVAPSGLL